MNALASLSASSPRKRGPIAAAGVLLVASEAMGPGSRSLRSLGRDDG
jgi:hypothetical protein